MIDKVFLPFYNEGELGGVEMHPGLNKYMMQLRMESKAMENQSKPPLSSPDVVQTADFTFSQFNPLGRIGDSGPLLLAKRKTNRKEKYVVKHAYTDCACNEFVYAKLARAMGCTVPDSVPFQLSEGEKRKYFKTEYIIGSQYLDLENDSPAYTEIREKAENWYEYFSFWGMYAMFSESDSFETPLAKNGLIYRIDTTDAFPISTWQLDDAGINFSFDGKNPYDIRKKQLFSSDFSMALNTSWCDLHLEHCLKKDAGSRSLFLAPFARIQEIGEDYIDDFLNTLCYFYPDFIGDYFKRYISALQKQCVEYWKEKR